MLAAMTILAGRSPSWWGMARSPRRTDGRTAVASPGPTNVTPQQGAIVQRSGVSTGEPLLIINPRGDEAFVAFVRDELRAGTSSAAAFETRLRSRYPLASVRERGLAGEARATWYIYREGRWITSES